MSKEIALFMRKFENKNKLNDMMIPSRNRFYINLMFYLQELGHKILIYDQRLFEKELSGSYIEWIKKNINFKYLKKPNLPFVSKKITNSDFEFFEHTITKNKNQNIINIKPFYLSDHYYFERMGFSAWSEIASLKSSFLFKNNNNVNIFFKKYYDNIVLNNLSKYNQPQKNRLNLPSKYFFLPLQLIDDTVNKLCEYSTEDFLKKFINLFSKSNENLIIKRHPKCKSKIITNILNNIDVKNILV